MNRIMMAVMALALSVVSSAVFAEDDAADATNSNTVPGSGAPSQDRSDIQAPGRDAAPDPEADPGQDAQTSVQDAVPDRNARRSIPDARAAAPSPDRAVRH